MDQSRFQRKFEDFKCVNCGARVKGTGYTDHCPACLTGMHVDVNPGDRKSDCRGVLKPLATEYANGAFTIVYRCDKCRATKRFGAAPEDDYDALMRLRH